jgi:hypothetical protein
MQPAVEEEWAEMLRILAVVWERAVRNRLVRDPAEKALAAKYPMVLLYSRRYAGGGYFQSTYSFLYETADEKKHLRDVQLQFDNGRGDRTFGINMVNHQSNRVADLGEIDFDVDPDPAKVKFEGDKKQSFEAFLGHVYLEKVEDTNGNRFFVLFKVVAVDEQSRYMAFVWRRLLGGTIVRRK